MKQTTNYQRPLHPSLWGQKKKSSSEHVLNTEHCFWALYVIKCRVRPTCGSLTKDWVAPWWLASWRTFRTVQLKWAVTHLKSPLCASVVSNCVFLLQRKSFQRLVPLTSRDLTLSTPPGRLQGCPHQRNFTLEIPLIRLGNVSPTLQIASVHVRTAAVPHIPVGSFKYGWFVETSFSICLFQGFFL